MSEPSAWVLVVFLAILSIMLIIAISSGPSDPEDWV